MSKKITITFDKEQVVQHVIRLINIVPNKPQVPMHEFYLFDLQDMQTCHIYASESNMTMRCTANVQADSDGIKFCIPAKLFTETVNLLHEPAFTITILDKVLQLKSGKSKYKMGIEDGVYFPLIEEGNPVNEVAIRGDHFKEAISTVTSFINKKVDNQLRNVPIYLLGNKVVIGGGDSVVINRHNIMPHSVTSFKTCYIPFDTANILKFIFNDKDIIDIFHDEKTIMFDNGNFRLTCNGYSGKYPNIDKYFTYKEFGYFKVSVSYLQEALKRILLYSADGVFSVMLKLTEDTLTLTSENDIGHAGEDVLEITGGKEFFVGLNCHKLIQILSSMNTSDENKTEFVRIYLQDVHSKPVFLTDDNDSPIKEFLLSPLMIKNNPK